jgi:hypothetical protein
VVRARGARIQSHGGNGGLCSSLSLSLSDNKRQGGKGERRRESLAHAAHTETRASEESGSPGRAGGGEAARRKGRERRGPQGEELAAAVAAAAARPVCSAVPGFYSSGRN